MTLAGVGEGQDVTPISISQYCVWMRLPVVLA
jgi:hypothetical protein